MMMKEDEDRQTRAQTKSITSHSLPRVLLLCPYQFLQLLLNTQNGLKRRSSRAYSSVSFFSFSTSGVEIKSRRTTAHRRQSHRPMR